MNGAESLVRTLVAGGVDTWFTNPGTSEMHIVAALDRQPAIRCVLGLFEGVATGAADGYARMAGKPAVTLLHLGPGLANGLANLHNASRAHVPIVNIVGQHPISHLQHATPLSSDIEGIARPFSSWLRTSNSATNLGRDAAEAVSAARTHPGKIATLVVSVEAAWSAGGEISVLPPIQAPSVALNETIERAAAMLESGLPSALLLSGNALLGAGLAAASRIAAVTKAKLFVPYPFARLERGPGLAIVERIPYVYEHAVERLKEFRQLILVGAQAPVAYFAFPGRDARLTSPACDIFMLSRPDQDGAGSLALLEQALGGTNSQGSLEIVNRPIAPSGPITLEGLATAIAAELPENAVVIDESMTAGRTIMSAIRGSARHDFLANTGGSIGIAMPLAVGAAIACPSRHVLCLSADGSGMYTAQALWTMAREGQKITTVVFANRSYGILKFEFSKLGIGEPGARARSLFDIGRPDINWVSLARGMGVPAERVTSLETFASALRKGFSSEGPTLIEVPL
jgi:acetolactate synthase I/II/III large subunit